MFCGNCGKELDGEAKYCPACGRSLRDTPEHHSSGGREHAAPAVEYSSKPSANSRNDISYIGILCIIWAVIAVLSAISILFSDVAGIVNQAFDEETVRQLIEAGFTQQDIDSIKDATVRLAYVIGGFLLASGILAIVSAVYCFKRKRYNVAVWTAMLSTVCGIPVVVGIFGFLVAYMIYRNKDSFTPEAAV